MDVITLSADFRGQSPIYGRRDGTDIAYGVRVDPCPDDAIGGFIFQARAPPQEAEAPFAEPAMFVINGEGVLKMIDISNAPFLRPDLDQVLRGVKANQVEGYPNSRHLQGVVDLLSQLQLVVAPRGKTRYTCPQTPRMGQLGHESGAGKEAV